MSIDSLHCESSLLMDDSQKIQKFGTGSSSSKRTLFRDPKTKTDENDSLSGEDSDLGPMSPLAFTDQSPTSINYSSQASSVCSSPGRDYASPFATPEGISKQSPISHLSWDRLVPGSGSHHGSESTSPFSALKKISRAARHSSRRKIFPDSPNSLPSTPRIPRGTPRKIDMSIIPNDSEVIPETPQKSFEAEVQNGINIGTPDKSNSPEHRLITPLGSVSKSAPLPKLHRRKSLCPLEYGELSSPERKKNVLKRHAYDTLVPSGTKLLKTEDNCSIPKARAALFKEKETEPKVENFSLSTKSFYSRNVRKSEQFPSVLSAVNDQHESRKRRSLPSYGGNYKRSMKRRKLGEINAGVSHGIRRPKPKRHSEVHKKVSHNTSQESVLVDKENHDTTITREKSHVEKNIIERPDTPVIDPNKRFFKTSKTSNYVATVTVNHKIKLKVSDGKIALKQRNNRLSKNSEKRMKLADISFDTADLTVDEPEIEASAGKTKVENILKVLEDDWADDDYDTMESLMDCTGHMTSPTTSIKKTEDVLMSPASVLSSMTSTMNIEDGPGPMDDTSADNIENADAVENNEKEPEKKYYPLFTKGYTANNSFGDETKASADGKKNTKWQMSSKTGGADDQYQLDVGQKRFGATQCPECHVVYQMGDPDDENAHLNYHNSIKTLKFPGWKNERVVFEDPFMGSRIILVKPGDPKPYWKKVSEILAVVDRDLGLADMSLAEFTDKKIYLYIQEKSVLGVLVAEEVKSAHRMIPELIELDCCTAESSPVKCGINVVWTAMSHRKQGIATKLVDTLRAKYFFGYIMSVDDIAFSVPTPSGKKFAERYTKTKNFKVYN